MPTDHVTLIPVLAPAEYAALDAFALQHRGPAALPAWSRFLKDRFAVDLVLDPDIVAGFITDSSNLPGRAEALARPASGREAAIVLRACYGAGIPITVSGGKSNLTGSATPEGGVVMSTVGLCAPEVAVDVAGQIARVPVGIILEDLRQAVRRLSNEALVFPVDPTSRADASVGGALACNASGFVPGAAGAMRRWVTGLDLLLPNGWLVKAERGQYISAAGRFGFDDGRQVLEVPVPRYPRPPIKNASGPFSAPDGIMDLVDWVVGSEGLFGLITACALKLAPKPAALLDLFFSLPEEQDALKFYTCLRTRLKGDFSQLGALEYFGVNCRRYMDHGDLLFRGNNQVGLYLQVPLTDTAVDDAAAAWLDILLQADCHIADDAVILLDNERDWKRFMEARHSMPANALEVVKERGAYTIMTDTVVPPERFPEFLAFTHAAIAAESLDYLAFGHFGDCHLHFTILPHHAQIDRAVAVYDAIIARSAALGGVYSGEHGTGKRKRADFLKCYGPAAADQLRQCKRAVDPEFLLNRGNVIAAS